MVTSFRILIEYSNQSVSQPKSVLGLCHHDSSAVWHSTVSTLYVSVAEPSLILIPESKGKNQVTWGNP